MAVNPNLPLFRIKRSSTSGNPSILANGELAYSYYSGAGGNKLYIGTGSEVAGNAVNHTVIGGKYYTDLLGGEYAPFGTLTANTALIVDSNGWINRFNVGTFQFNENTLSTAIGDIVLAAAGNINVSDSRITNLGTPIDAKDAVTKEYADGIAANAVFTVAAGSESKTFTPAEIPLTFAADSGLSAQLDSSTNTVTYGLTSSGVVAGTYGTQSQIPNITVDSFGRITDVTTSNISTEIQVNGKSISLLDSDLTFTGSDNIVATFDSDTNTVDYALSKNVIGLESLAVDNIVIDGNTIKTIDSSNTLILDPAPTEDDGGTVIVRGNLVVQGTQTTINSTSVSVNDLTLTLASGAGDAAAADGAGIIIDGANVSITYDANTDRLTTNTGLNVAGPFTINGESIAEVIDDKVASLLIAGDGLDVSYNDSGNGYTISAELASTSNTGVASFDSDQFNVNSGHVTVSAINGNNVALTFKTYNTSGDVPTEQELTLGEVAINTADGKMFLKKDFAGIESIIELGGGFGGAGGTFDTFEFLVAEGQTVFSGVDIFGNTLAYDTDMKLLIFLNGILLTNGVDYTATDGTSVTFSIALLAGYTVQFAAYIAGTTTVANDIGLQDNVRLMFGTGYDTIISHDGNNTNINQFGIGDIVVQHHDSDIVTFAQDKTIFHKEVEIQNYHVKTNRVLTSGSLSPVVVDIIPISDFRSSRFTIQMSNISSQRFQTNEVLLVHDNLSVYTTNFGELFTGLTSEGTISAAIVGTDVVLSITPTSTNSYEFTSVRHSITI